MLQFVHGSDAAFADLESRAKGCCVLFCGQLLPPGAVPRRARVGFEIDPADGSAILLVDRGVCYSGTNPSVRRWLHNGRLRFSSFSDLKHWIRAELARICVHTRLARPRLTESPGFVAKRVNYRCRSLDSRTGRVTRIVRCLAADYGLRLVRLSPALMLTVLRRSRGGSARAMSDEELVTGVLGNIFASAAAAGLCGSVELRGGPPFEVVPIEGAHDHERE